MHLKDEFDHKRYKPKINVLAKIYSPNKAIIFYYLIYEPSYYNFPENRKKIFKPPSLNINCLLGKIEYIFEVLSVYF